MVMITIQCKGREKGVFSFSYELLYLDLWFLREKNLPDFWQYLEIVKRMLQIFQVEVL